MLQFSRRCLTIQGPTTNVFVAAEVRRQGKARHLDEVTRDRSSMEVCRPDFKVVRLRRTLFME